MADGSEHTGEKPPMHPKIAAFLDETFPNDGRRHTLALGELHDLSEHTQWLRDHLDALQARGVTTIGVERPAYMNVFLWAYADGTLARALGGWEQAKDYMRSSWTAGSNPGFRTGEENRIELLMDALDHGLHVVCYDTRRGVSELLPAATDDLPISPEVYSWLQRLFAKGDMLNVSMAARALVVERSNNLTRFDDPIINGVIRGWLQHELIHLLETNPEYREKLEAIEVLRDVGHRLIRDRRIGSDGLSACMMQALAPDTGNCITIGGAAHNSGVFVPGQYAASHIHGMFPHHLQQIAEYSAGHAHVDENAPRAHRVSNAVLASADQVVSYKEETKQERGDSIPSAIPIVTLEDGAQHTLATYDKGDAKYLRSDDEANGYYAYAGTRYTPRASDDTFVQGRAKQFANPMLIPELKKACDRVHTIMHGEPVRER